MKTKNHKYTILIIDDAPANIRVLVETLMNEYEISVATNGPEGLEIVRSNQPPDLILLDIIMPEMDGYEVCKAIRSDPRTKDIPVIFVTANTDDQTLEEAFQAGGTDYVRKPISRIELMARIRSALNHQELVRKLIQEEKLEGVLEMAGAVCHELNQPMQTISGFSQLLLMNLPKTDPKYEHLSIIKKEIENMAEITKKLMRITRYETCQYIDNLKIIDINKAVGS